MEHNTVLFSGELGTCTPTTRKMSSRSPAREPPAPGGGGSAGSASSWSSEQDSKNEIVKMLFAIETHEHVLKDFSCAYQGTILLHGRLYVLQRTLCFYSNIFGHETRKIVPITSITGISKRSTLGIIPTAIEISVAGRDKVVFASFFGSSSRNECYDLVSKLHMETGFDDSRATTVGDRSGDWSSRHSVDSDRSMMSEYSATSSAYGEEGYYGRSNGRSQGESSSKTRRSSRDGRERTLSEPAVHSPLPSASRYGHHHNRSEDSGGKNGSAGRKGRRRGTSGSLSTSSSSSSSLSSSSSSSSPSRPHASFTPDSSGSASEVGDSASASAAGPAATGTAATLSSSASVRAKAAAAAGTPSRPLSPKVSASGPVDLNTLAVKSHTELCRGTFPVSVRELYDMLFSSKLESTAFLGRR
jgi:hypothetical protein